MTDLIGRFLNFSIKELKDSDNQIGAYQCYFCLYGIVLKVIFVTLIPVR
jgi:hypothetical protein